MMWYHYSRSISRGRETKTKIINTQYIPIFIQNNYIRALDFQSMRLTYWPSQQVKCKKCLES